MSALVLRELRLAATGGSALLPLIFFLLVATLFPFAVGPDAPLLARTGGGALWMAALLAALLPVDRLVEPDRAAGVLDQLAVRGHRRGEVALAKLAGHWLSFGPPLMLAALPAAALMKLPPAVLARLELGLLAGTPGLAALTLIVAALTAGPARTTGALGRASAAAARRADPDLRRRRWATAGAPARVKLLAAASLLLVAIAPFAAGAAIRAARGLAQRAFDQRAKMAVGRSRPRASSRTAMSPHSTRPPRPASAWLSSSPIASADIRTA